LPICEGNKEDLLPLLVTHLKGLLHFEHINFKSKPDSGHGNELAQWNVHSGFLLGIDLEFLQDFVGVELVLALDPLDYILT
jgi:hypothetical protein